MNGPGRRGRQIPVTVHDVTMNGSLHETERTPSIARSLDRLIASLEGEPLLDRAADKLVRPVRRVVGEGRRRDVLTGVPQGHPAHPSVVGMPLGCWTGAVMLDLLGGRAGRRAAQRLVGLGVASAIPTMASGAADWIDTEGAERRVGFVHAAGNVAATLLFGLSWRARRRNHHFHGVLWSGLGAIVATGAGFLGGHLSFRRGVGVDTTAFSAGPGTWTTLDLPVNGAVNGAPLPLDAQPVLATAAGTHLVVTRDELGALAVLEDRCTHRGGPLHEGTVDGGCISCPWHGSRFDVQTGAVRQGPAVAPQPVYDIDVADDGSCRVRREEPGSLRRMGPSWQAGEAG